MTAIEKIDCSDATGRLGAYWEILCSLCHKVEEFNADETQKGIISWPEGLYAWWRKERTSYLAWQLRAQKDKQRTITLAAYNKLTVEERELLRVQWKPGD